jgi:hypothetical protein
MAYKQLGFSDYEKRIVKKINKKDKSLADGDQVVRLQHSRIHIWPALTCWQRGRRAIDVSTGRKLDRKQTIIALKLEKK